MSDPEFARRDASADLCRSCGLCCNGSFFGSVELKPTDDEAALAQLLPLEHREGKVVFRQPCPAFRGGCCTIYEGRPQTCRRYRCRVLRGVEQNYDVLPEALEKVAELSRSFAALKACLRTAGFLASDLELPAAIVAFRAAYATALDAGEAGFFAQHRELILRWKKTAWLVHEHFDEIAAARLGLPLRSSAAPGDVSPS